MSLFTMYDEVDNCNAMFIVCYYCASSTGDVQGLENMAQSTNQMLASEEVRKHRHEQTPGHHHVHDVVQHPADLMMPIKMSMVSLASWKSNNIRT